MCQTWRLEGHNTVCAEGVFVFLPLRGSGRGKKTLRREDISQHTHCALIVYVSGHKYFSLAC